VHYLASVADFSGSFSRSRLSDMTGYRD